MLGISEHVNNSDSPNPTMVPTTEPTAEPTDQPTAEPTFISEEVPEDETVEVLFRKSKQYTPEYSTVITYLDMADSMHFEMTISVHSLPNNGFRNILHCGFNSTWRFPVISVHDSSMNSTGNYTGFFIKWRSGSESENAGPGATGDPLVLDREYILEIDITQVHLLRTC